MSEDFPRLQNEVPRLRFGVAGERKLPDAQSKSADVGKPLDAPWLVQRFDEIWQLAAEVIALGHKLPGPIDASPPKAKLRLAVGMAIGADQVAIDRFSEACKNAGGIGHELLLIYPSTPDAFAACSESQAIADFAQRRASLLSPQTDLEVAEVVLDGKLPRSDSLDAPPPLEPLDPALLRREKRMRNAANSYQSEALIRQSEFLIAVFDRRKSGDVGGTRGTIELALLMETPVLLLDPITQHAFEVGYLDQLAPEFTPNAQQSDWRRSWQQKLRRVLAVPTSDSPAHHARPDPETQLRGWAFEPPSTPLLHTNRWEAFNEPFKVPAEPYKKSLLAAIEQDASSKALGAPKAISAPPPDCTVSGTVTLLLQAVLSWSRAQSKGIAKRTVSPLVEHWRVQIADAQAQAMDAYRSVFVSNYLLGLFAVLLAVGAFAILAGTGLKPGLYSLSALAAITLLKLAIVVRISRNTHRAEHSDFAGHAVGLRYLSERLRIMPTMLLAGSSRVDLLHQTPRRGAPHRVLEDICRRLPLSACAGTHNSSAALESLRKLIQSQLSYHLGGLAKMQLLHMHLNHAVQLAGKAVIGIVVADLVVLGLKGAHKLHAFDALLSPEWLYATGSALGWIGLICVALTALLPALMATLNAIQFQSQAEQLAERHGAMAAALRVLKNETDLVQAQIESPSASLAVLALCERAAGLFAEEVAEWATMYRQGVKES